MQPPHTSNQTMWKQVYQNALFELDPKRLLPKLEAAQKAIEVRLCEISSRGGTDRRELMELEDAKRTIVFLRRQ